MTDQAPVDRSLELAWQALSPEAGLRERVRSRLAAGSAPGSNASEPLGVTTVRRATSRWRALRASGSLGVAAGALLLGLGFIVGYWSRPTQAEAPSPMVPPTPFMPTGLGDVASVASVASVDVVARRTETDKVRDRAAARAVPARQATAAPARKSVAPRSAPRSTPATDGEELRLLARAERAVRAGQGELALSLSLDLEQRFPRTLLDEERRAIELMARCRLGASDRAERVAQFGRDYPKSVYAERVAKECDALDAAPSAAKEIAPGSTKANAADIDGLEGGQHAPSSSP